MPRYSVIPVGAVEPEWFDQEFLSFLRSAIDAYRACGGVVWVGADDSNEADWLLLKAQRYCESLGIPICEVSIDPADPVLVWEDILGWLDSGGLAASLNNPSLLVVRGGAAIPEWSLRAHLPSFRAICRGQRIIGCLPVLDGVLGAVSLAPPTEMSISVPPLAQNAESVLTALARELLDREFRQAGNTIAPSEPVLTHWAECLVRSKPRSRTEIEKWVTRVVAEIDTLQAGSPVDLQADIDDLIQQLPNERVPGPEFKSAAELKVRFDSAIARLDALNAAAKARLNRELYWDHQPFSNPFEAHDPWYWFIALVTRLYLLLVDHPAREGLAVISTQFRYDPLRGDIVGEPLSSLPDTVDCLRTLLQHGLREAAKENQARVTTVKKWYHANCENTAPFRRHGRVLAQALLRDFEELLQQLKLVLEASYSSETELMIQGTLARASRDVAQVEIAWALDAAAQLVATPVDIELLLRKHQARLRKEMRDCCLAGEAFQVYLRSRCELIVAEEILVCPIDGNWLKKRGVPQGPILGDLRRRLQDKWDANRTVPKDQFIEEAEKHLISLGYASSVDPADSTSMTTTKHAVSITPPASIAPASAGVGGRRFHGLIQRVRRVLGW